MKRKLISLVLFLAVLVSMISVPAFAASQSDTVMLDIVLVVDRSGSMLLNDKKKIAPASAEVFVNLCADTDRIAYIGYEYDVTVNTGFINASDPYEVDRVCALIEADTPSKNGDTDTGKALAAAYALIDAERAMNPTHTFAIVLISDGKIDIGDSTGAKNYFGRKPNAQERAQAVADSRALGESVVTAHTDIPLYCVGVNPDKTGSALGDDMRSWARMTEGVGGRYVAVTSFDGEDGAFAKVLDFYQAMKGQNDIEYKDGQFTLTVNVLTANIILYPGSVKTELITIKDPSGQTVDLNDPTQVLIKQDSKYTIISLNKPAVGTWGIELPKDVVYQVKVTTVPDVVVSFVDLQTSYISGDTVNLSITGTKAAQQYIVQSTDTACVRIYPADVSPLTNPGGYIQEIPLMPNTGTNTFDGTWSAQSVGSYKVVAYLNSTASGFQNATDVTNPAAFTVSSAGIRVKQGATLDYTFSGHLINSYQPYQVHVDSMFDNRDNLTATYHVTVDKPEYVNAEIFGQDLTITPLQDTGAVGPATVSVYATYTVPGEMMESRSQVLQGAITVQDGQAPVKADTTLLATFDYEVEDFLPMKAEKPKTVLTGVSAYFVEPNAMDGETFYCMASTEDGSIATAMVENDELKVVGLTKGTTTITVTATGVDGSTDSIVLNLTVKNMLEKIIMYAGVGLGALILLILLVLLLKWIMAPSYTPRSTLEITINTETDQLKGTIMMARFGKKKLKLSQLCTQARLSGITKEMSDKLRKVIVTPRKGGGLNVKNGKQPWQAVLKNASSSPMTLTTNTTVVLRFILP